MNVFVQEMYQKIRTLQLVFFQKKVIHDGH